jgi:signal transduction histidine kinase
VGEQSFLKRRNRKESSLVDKQRILIVEDHASLREAIRRTLEGAGYAMMPCGDGVEALRVMEETPPDLIVADILMPKMDGYDFYHAVRARSEWTSIPFIFLTALAERQDRLRGKALGVESYLTKPVDPEELLITIRARLARAQAVQASAESILDEVKQQIVTVLGHEMRTPLTHISGYTELALQDIASLPPELLEKFLQSISQGTDRLTNLADDFLMLVRLDTGQTKQEYQQLAEARGDLDMIVDRTVDRYERRAAAKGLRLNSLVQPGLPPVQLCELLFFEALGRLIDNAVKFTQGEGKTVMVNAREAQGWIEVAVIDEGIGISAKELPHLFERFRQIDRERMEQQGVGLGLSIAQGLIHLHGGEIAVTSTPGEGSTFTIKLPVAEA